MDSHFERVMWFLFRNFERALVILLVASLLGIHWLIDDKLAFLNFYFLPIILAGFYLDRSNAVLGGVLIVSLVVFFQAVQGLGVPAGLQPEILLTLVPWGGFLILTGWVIGLLSEQRQSRLNDLKGAYLSIIEVLTFYLEATENHQQGHHQQGHSHRVAALATNLGRSIGLHDEELENVRIAALFHEVGYRDPRLLKLLSRAPRALTELSTAIAMRGASEILYQYMHYYEVVGDVWPVDDLSYTEGVKILAVADAYETLLMPTPHRQSFEPAEAFEEIKKGAGLMFATGVVEALRAIVLENGLAEAEGMLEAEPVPVLAAS